MTIHLVSVGIDLTEKLAAPREHFGDHDLEDAIRGAKPETILDNGGTASASATLTGWFGGGSVPERVARMVASVSPQRWPQMASAELDTFARVRRLGQRRTRLEPSDPDAVVLLATDTVRGLAAAMWNAVALTDGDLARVHYLPDPESVAAFAAGSPLPGTALVVRVPNLDASDEVRFGRAMRGLGLLGKALLPTRRGQVETFAVHLSGGFKAAIPYLIGLAEGLRSYVSEPVARVDAYVMHQSTDGVIRLPLRRIPLATIKEELGCFDGQGRLLRRPVPPTLDGYAYELSESRLTAFGEGLWALVGVPPEAVGQG